MSGKQVCVTNLVPELRSCVVKGVHKSNCDGWLWRYDRETGQTNLAYRITWNPETRENERTMIHCPGCLPRIAYRGMLCQSHHEKLEDVFGYDDEGRRTVVDLVTHLWSIESGGVRDDNDRVASAFGSQWTLSESHLHANAIYTEMAATAVAFSVALRVPEPEWSAAATITNGFVNDLDVDIVGVIVRRLLAWLAEHAETAIRHKQAAAAATLMIGAVTAAISKFPMADAEHGVPFIRCPNCSRMSLVWRPPLYFADEVEIKCARCGHTENQDWLDSYIHLIRTDPRRKTS